MAKRIVRLGRHEAEQGELPMICMRCGAPATTRFSKKFSWHAQWVYALLFLGLVPMLIVGVIMTKRMRVQAPLCDQHINHWSVRSWVLVGGFLGIVALGLAGIGMAGYLPPNQADNVRGMVCGGGLLLGICWLILFIVLDFTAIGVTEITDYSITLKGVDSTFCDAVEDRHRAESRPDPTDDPRFSERPSSGGLGQYYKRDS